MRCARCSLGASLDDHEHDHDGGVAPWQPVRRLGIALRDETELDRLGDDLEILSVARVS
ncbi:MAG: hypothetical protein H6709_06225 [Kofleriaceae bacterium]|nr:hypothetical protein [Myxococcales bacterium]MCB9571671.1 hypothetical protein [Kofleriaceae bacterium]